MQRITSRLHLDWPLFNTGATQDMERRMAALLPPHTLMQRAGWALARLARALAPHARTVWVACGPGNNGGDGLEAAMHLRQHGLRVVVSWLGLPETAPPDALRSWQRACDAGVQFEPQPPAGMGASDLCIDALLGIGLSSGSGSGLSSDNSPLLILLAYLRDSAAPVLAVDVPSGLQTDAGQYAPGFAPPSGWRPCAPWYTLSLLTLKPGLFTGAGRDATGAVWFDNLGCIQNTENTEPPNAWLSGRALAPSRLHTSHKGSYGDVAVVGGEGLSVRGMGMTGAALLAARAALHSGAGRVFVTLLDDGAWPLDIGQPELMFRHWSALQGLLKQSTVVCGCGGGEAVRGVLPTVLAQAPRLVLDADALNAIATDVHLQIALKERASQNGFITLLTPHPLEAARLLGLGTDTVGVQADRLAAAQRLAERFGCIVVLKGSGTVVAAPGQIPHINPTGNAQLASAGTGDVLAGMLGASLASLAGTTALQATVAAVWLHGYAADQWPTGTPLTASALAGEIQAGTI